MKTFWDDFKVVPCRWEQPKQCPEHTIVSNILIDLIFRRIHSKQTGILRHKVDTLKFESAKLKLQFPKFKLIQYRHTPQQKFIILIPYYSSLNPQGSRTCVSFFWKGKGRFLSTKAGNQCMCTVMYLHDLDSLEKTQKSTESTRAKLSSALFI